MAIQVDENDEFFRDIKIIKNDFEGRIRIRKVIEKIKTKDRDLKYILWHLPEILFETESPDNEILYYLMQAREIEVKKLTKDEFKKALPALSTIRNFRRKVILDLQKRGYFLENEKKLREKDMYIKDKYMHDRM